jgi:uncharacterized membrane protein YkoI
MIALLAIGAMGVISTRSFAKAPTAQAQQDQAPDVEDVSMGPDTDNVQEQVGEQIEDDQPDAAEAAESPDTDTVEEQVGEQVEDGQPDGAEAPGAEDTGPDQQDLAYTGSVLVDQTAAEGISEADESAALAGQATISSDQAQAAALAANPGATVVKVELDNENGTLVYSVELSNGSDVKVDAGNGAILYMDTGGDNEG